MTQSFIQRKYKETIDFLYRKLPVFERIGPAAYKKDLSNIKALCGVLDHPQERIKSIHIAGTNGKGSVSHMLASIFQEAGYKTGLYISPHYKDYRERIRINGKWISKQYIIDFVERVRPDIDRIRPSFFEITVAMAFDYFSRNRVDVAVVETGLGGRLDSTNILLPELSIITNISLDHQNLLGDSVEKIAFEKAGIIKPGVPCLIGEYQRKTYPVFKQAALASGTSVRCADRLGIVQKMHAGHYRYSRFRRPFGAMDLLTPLLGPYQEKNINTAIEAVRLLHESGKWTISNQHIQSGFKKLSENAPLTGRWQWLGNSPRVLADGAHNLAGLQYLFKELEKTEKGHIHCVFGMVRDKDIDPVLAVLPRQYTYYFVKADLPRALNAELLAEKAAAHGLNGAAYGKVSMGFRAAKKAARDNDLVLVTGSIFVVGEVI